MNSSSINTIKAYTKENEFGECRRSSKMYEKKEGKRETRMMYYHLIYKQKKQKNENVSLQEITHGYV